ncbi:LOW QUALITY PROTEIN: proteinase-activated receptor 3 [Colossoma macropomum]|uniref:LOW QUALITY PROTEIN: proteinase-activated receptor 3 n=1 Tax=Colossoma macropomum TaxID=42526 RepID=UPI001864EBA9|nr:LOW QUALITY PROTEIN: proteinase-activated receptor 3 [Colossoma macropomum]
MGKTLLIVIMTVLLLELTRGTNRGKNRHNRTEGISPRTFRGQTIPSPASPPSKLHGNLPCSSPSEVVEPGLRLLSNSTVMYLRGALSTRAIPAVYIVAIVVGIPANVAILVSIGAKVRRVSSAILYCSLATSDLLLLLSLLLKMHYHFAGNDWTFGEAACRLVTACFYGNLYCSAHTLACISVKRYLAVVHPFLYKSLPKRSCTAWASLAVWVMFSIAMVPELLVRQSYRIPQLGITTCHDVLPVDQGSSNFLVYYNLGLTLLGFLLPLMVTTACYTSIVWELNRSHRDWSLYIKASTLVFFIFVLGFAPSNFIHFLHYVQLYSSGAENFYAYFNVAVCLCCLHSCLDPFLFMLMSRTAGSKFYFMIRKGKTLSIST